MPSSVWRLRIINLTISQPDVTHLKPIIVEYSGDVVSADETSWGSVKSLFR